MQKQTETNKKVGRPRLSDEERKLRIKESNSKYYQKIRLLVKQATDINKL